MKTKKNIWLIAIAVLNFPPYSFSQEPTNNGCDNIKLIIINSPSGIGMVRNAVSRSKTAKNKNDLNNTKMENTSAENKLQGAL